jgi:aminotransferase
VISYESLLSPVVREMKPSGIRKFFDLANEMDHVISLGVGEPDFKTPFQIRQAGIESLEKGRTWYTANAGLLELREEIARYLKRRFDLSYRGKEEVVVTVGGSEAIDLAVRALVAPGDEVLIPEPSFVCYTPIVQLAGGVPVAIETKEEDQFKLTPKALLEAITDRTKLLVLPYPNNPTGGVMRREDLEPIAEILRDRNIMVLSDEIYAELTYHGRHVSIASLDGMWERTIVVNGFSKAYAMTGWRLGYAAGPAPVIKQMTKVHQFAIMSAPTTSQYAAVTALREGDESIERMVVEYDMRRRLVVDTFRRMGLSCFEPEGAFYVFPCIQSTGLTSEEFCERLLRAKHVAVVPGDAFGASGEGFVRVSYSYSVKHLIEAMKRIREFLEELSAEKGENA